jgi:hypothetical protein
MLGNIFKFAAPIAAGAFAGPAGFQLAGSAMAGSIAAGAATGAGIAALSGDDVLSGAVTGGLGGMGGGSLANAATATGQQAATADMIAKGGGGIHSGMVTGAPTAGQAFTASVQNPGMFLKNLGDGSTAMGAGKVGIMGLGAANSVGAFTPELPKYDDDPRNKYDPKRRLDLSMNTGINDALRRDSGLRLLAGGGTVLNPSNNFYQNTIGGRVYTGPRDYSTGEPLYPDPQAPAPEPVRGFVDVGGKFVASDDGDITQAEYNERYSYDKSDTEDQDSGGDMEAIDAAAKSGVNPLTALKAAQGYAQSQQSPVKDQALGLKDLQAGGYLETGGRVGDGMSDEIPATIDGTQEARLSDGEFVVPADVVSHLGNGSSDAGAKRLYEMMDKVRMARTGNKQQGKEIEPERYMPV